MNPNLINLLPKENVRLFRRAYFYRLLTVAALAGTALFFISALLLFPSYLLAHNQVQLEQGTLTELNKTINSSEGQGATARVAALRENINRLGLLKTAPKASALLRGILAVSHSGITLSSFVVTPPIQTTPGKVTLSGTADTREVLRMYTVELGKLSYVSTVDLPISVYAKETDIPFTITLTGTLIP